MRTLPLIPAFILLAVSPARAQVSDRPGAFQLPDSIVVRDGRTGARIDADEFLRRLAGADLVLLGEVHDNGIQHALRGQLIAALASRRPAIVFEQFAATEAPFAPPAAGEPLEQWLDQHGFDRNGWKWPVHQPVVDAAIKHGRALWGAGLSREVVSPVVRGGESAAPAQLRPILAQLPLDSAARAALDHELDVGHCGQLPPQMVPGMRAAQVTRDASMARALASASTSGPAWLIAGNGHVRRDFAVPRLLQVTAPGKSVLAVGFLERKATGAEPDESERAVFDVVVVTPRSTRPDPCAGVR